MVKNGCSLLNNVISLELISQHSGIKSEILYRELEMDCLAVEEDTKNLNCSFLGIIKYF